MGEINLEDIREWLYGDPDESTKKAIESKLRDKAGPVHEFFKSLHPDHIYPPSSDKMADEPGLLNFESAASKEMDPKESRLDRLESPSDEYATLWQSITQPPTPPPSIVVEIMGKRNFDPPAPEDVGSAVERHSDVHEALIKALGRYTRLAKRSIGKIQMSMIDYRKSETIKDIEDLIKISGNLRFVIGEIVEILEPDGEKFRSLMDEWQRKKSP